MKTTRSLLVALLLSLLGSELLMAQKASELFKAQIPSDWEVLDEQYGDLNKDSISDAAIIIQEKGEGTGEYGKRRTIMVFFKGKDGGYKLVSRGETSIMGDQAGGMMGDPYQSMKIIKNVIVLDFWGGSRDKWGLTHRYRFQNGDFYLIGATNQGGDGITNYNYDYNVSTGKMILTVKDKENPKKNVNETKIVKQDPLPSLKTFKPFSTLTFDGDVSF